MTATLLPRAERQPHGSPAGCYQNSYHGPVIGYVTTDSAPGFPPWQESLYYVCAKCRDQFLGELSQYGITWDFTPLAPPAPEAPAAPGPDLLAALTALRDQRRARQSLVNVLSAIVAKQQHQEVNRMSAAEILTPVVEAHVVAAGEGGHNIVSFPVPGDGDKMLRVPALPENISRGGTVHVRLKVEPRFQVLAVGAPGELGAVSAPAQLAPFPAPAPAVTLAPPPADDAGLPLGLRHVSAPANFFVTEQLKSYFAAINKLSLAGHRVNGRFIGPTGAGKSTAVYYFAASTKRPLLRVNMATITSPEELLGRWELTGGETRFQETALVRALEHPQAVIFLEEVNRTHSSNVNPLMDIMDAIGEVWIDAIGRLIRVHPTVVILGAMNVGAAYTGTFDMDLALESRFEYPFEVGYLPPDEEAKVLVLKTGADPAVATGFVELANNTRALAQSEGADQLDKAISTRTLLAACHLVATGGLSPAQALQATVLPLYSIEGGTGSQRERVAQLVKGKFDRGGKK